MKVNYLAILLILSFSCSPKIQKFMSDFELFKSYIQGDLDNKAQVDAEIKAGKQIHPYAKHVNRLFDRKIKNLPENYNGFYILEESYYTYPNKPTEIKPYLFWFEKTEGGRIKLHSIQIPKGWDKKDIRNDNPNFVLDFADLIDSPTFTPIVYTKTDKGFYIKAPVNLPNGVKFTLEETIGKDTFEVMESLEKDDKLLTPYSTPIIYKRI
ncbi:MAG: hypothetical protein U5N85_06280 [Arcicella sp.]|nr:hypothetical protein [Arcicella sp.]